MKTYLGWTTLMPWHKYFTQYSIDVRINQISKSLSLWHLAWLLRPLVLLSMCFFMASLQVYADGKKFPINGKPKSIADTPSMTNDVPTIEIDFGDKTTSKAINNLSEATDYENLDKQIEKVAQDSNLIFHGKVIDVEYQQADTGTPYDYPVTYITFSIFEILQGTYNANEIVLMLPGMGLTSRHTFATRSDLPIFAKNDELIMFLASGAQNGPRYVHHLFTLEGGIYDGESHVILKDDSEAILRGALVPKSEILERRLGIGSDRMVREAIDVTNPDALGITPPALAPGYSQLDVQSLSKLLPQPAQSISMKSTASSSPFRAAAIVESADKNRPLFFPPEADAMPGRKP